MVLMLMKIFILFIILFISTIGLFFSLMSAGKNLQNRQIGWLLEYRISLVISFVCWFIYTITLYFWWGYLY